MSSIKRNGGKVLNQNEKRLGCRCLQSNNKCEDFDEAMLIVQVRVGKFEVRDVLLDSGSSVNIISKSLRKKIRLRRPQSASFVVRMVDQGKVQPIGFRNLKINLVGCDYKISAIVLNMENGVEAYSMLWPWLKLVIIHHNWGDSTLVITLGESTVTLSTIKNIY